MTRPDDSLRIYRAAWVLPISRPPIQHGLIAVRSGRLVGVSDDPASLLPPSIPSARLADTEDLGDCAVLPGLVNAHTHLELSWMRGRVAPGHSMPEWVGRLIALRRAAGGDAAPPIVDAIREVRAAGTTLVGDVSNTLASCGPLAESTVGGIVFRELLGFAVTDPDRVVADALAHLAAAPSRADLRTSVVPHAPYSVSPALFRRIAAAAGNAPLSVHLGESKEEMQFLRDGTGTWRDLLTRLGAWDDGWVAPGCGPVEYLDRLGLVTDRLLAVHGTQLDAAALRRLAVAGATVVACPRSNRWTGAGVPPIEAFYASGVRVAIGTDSLASVEDLSLFGELAEVRRLAPGVPAARLLESATRHGASALGFGADFGTLERGKRAELLAVQIPAGVKDVEEYLLSGIQPDQVRWLD